MEARRKVESGRKGKEERGERERVRHLKPKLQRGSCLHVLPTYLLHSLSNQVKHRFTFRCPGHSAGPSVHVSKRERER